MASTIGAGARRRPGWRLALGAALAGVAALVAARAARGPAGAPAWFDELRAGDVWRLPRGLASRKLTLAGETRNARFAGAPVELRVVPPARAELEVSGALRCALGARCRGAAVFEVRARSGDEERVLARFRQEAAWREDYPEAVPVDGPPARWHAERVSLAEYAGRELSLELVVTPEEAPPETEGDEAPAAFWGEPLLLAPVESGQPNLLLVSIDTLRADRLSGAGYARDTSPRLDRLANTGVRFTQAIAQAPWTTPSHMSLFTGLYPSTHAATERLASGRMRPLAPGVPTLAALLRARGWHTRAYTGGGTMGAALGFDRGFDVYFEGPLKITDEVRSGVRGLTRGLARVPFFLYVHTFEVHAPYVRTHYVDDRLSDEQRRDWHAYFDGAWRTQLGHRALAPAPTREPGVMADALARAIAKRAALRGRPLREFLEGMGLWNAASASALYDGGVRVADDFVGGLLDALHGLGLEGRTAVIVTSDHGEEFGEHAPERFWDAHCVTLYDELIHVPLLMRLPGIAPGTVREQVQLVDVAPTLLEWLGLGVPGTMQGRSLLPLLRGGAPAAPRWAFAEATCSGPEYKALRRADLKYVGEFDPQVLDGATPLWLRGEQLFRIDADPGEQRDLSAVRLSRAANLGRQLVTLAERLRRARVADKPRALDAGARERLRALGYVP